MKQGSSKDIWNWKWLLPESMYIRYSVEEIWVGMIPPGATPGQASWSQAVQTHGQCVRTPSLSVEVSIKTKVGARCCWLGCSILHRMSQQRLCKEQKNTAKLTSHREGVWVHSKKGREMVLKNDTHLVSK